MLNNHYARANMDVVIITTGAPDAEPLEYFRTIGAYKIAHVVRKNGFSAKVIDHAAAIYQDNLVKILSKYVTNETKILAVSTTFFRCQKRPPARFGPQIVFLPDNVVLSIKEICENYPNLKLIFGGYGVSGARSESRLFPYATITSYGEDIFVDVLKHIAGKGAEPRYEVAYTQNETTGENISPFKVYSSPLVNRYNIEVDDFQWTEDDNIMPGEVLPLEISRGCIFKCKFCNHLLLGRGKLDYLRSFELIKNELLYNYEKWKTTNYYIICDTFNDTEIKMKAWSDMVNSLPFKIHYTCYLRADLLHAMPNVPHMLKESGLLSCYHGIESFHPHASVVIGKGWSSKGAKNYLPELYHNIWKGEVYQTLSFIAGLPRETREDLLTTCDWFIQNKMRHMSMGTLSIMEVTERDNVDYRNASEFERNAEKYGYSFFSKNPRDQRGKYWKTDYWDAIQAEAFVVNVLRPKFFVHNNPIGDFSSWRIMSLLQYDGFTADMLKTGNIRLPDLAPMANRFRSNYIKSLLE